MAEAADVFVDLVDQIKDRSATYEAYHAYWQGASAIAINSDEFRSRFGTLFSNLVTNICRPVIEIAESRIRIVEWEGEDGEQAQDIWKANRMPVESRWVMQDAMVKGESFVIVMPDDAGNPTIYPQVSEQVAVLYDAEDPRQRIAAMKWWVIAELENGREKEYARVNVYFDDRIEKYRSKRSASTLEAKLDKYTLIETEYHDLEEVPVYQFSVNWDQSDGMGRSDIADVTPLQDALNKTLLDLMVTSEYTSAPQRWATGIEIPLDPKTGKPQQTYRSGADRLWTAPNDAARFGQFQAGDMSGYRQMIETLIDHAAFVSRTPQYALFRMANYPSGEALKTVEAPLRSRVMDHQAEFDAVWTEVMDAAMRIAGRAEANAEPRWLPANHPFNTSEFLEELKIKAEVLGVPQEMLWIEAGYTMEQIARMKTMRSEEAATEFNVAEFAAAELLSGAVPAPTVGGLAPDQAAPADAGFTEQ